MGDTRVAPSSLSLSLLGRSPFVRTKRVFADQHHTRSREEMPLRLLTCPLCGTNLPCGGAEGQVVVGPSVVEHYRACMEASAHKLKLERYFLVMQKEQDLDDIMDSAVPKSKNTFNSNSFIRHEFIHSTSLPHTRTRARASLRCCLAWTSCLWPWRPNPHA